MPPDVLGFNGLNNPHGVAASGNTVFVTHSGNNRVLKLDKAFAGQ
jgi:hypothetical protein